jgi:hypothetical protein
MTALSVCSLSGSVRGAERTKTFVTAAAQAAAVEEELIADPAMRWGSRTPARLGAACHLGLS